HTRWRPRTGLISLVGVDGRRVKTTKFRAVLNESAQKLPKQFRRLLAPGIPKRVLPAAPQADVNVTRIPWLIHVRLGHKRNRAPILRGDFLDALLKNDMPIRHRQRLVVNKIDLV